MFTNTCPKTTIGLLKGNVGEPMASDIKKETATHLKSLLERDGVYPAEFARSLGVSASTVSKWLKGRALPDSLNIDKMLDIYGWTKEDLFLGYGRDLGVLLKLHNDSASPFIIGLRNNSRPTKKS